MSEQHNAEVGDMNEEGRGRLPGHRRRTLPPARRRRHQPGLVAQAAQPQDPAQAPVGGRPHGPRLRLRSRVRLRRHRRADPRRRRRAHDLAGLVARRLRPLRRLHDPHGVAQRGHLPRQRRPRRGGRGHAALRAAQQLAGQRQPGQGAQAAVAGQEEVRPHGLVGRPDGLHGQPRPGDHGLHDLRLRGRPRGRLGARRGRLLGPGGHLARRRALHRRPRAGEAARRRPDGPDLRQPGGPQRQPGPARPPPATSARRSAAWR